jgi:tetratricopeptide (TPR) repeat protein
VDSRVQAAGPVVPRRRRVTWPVRSGTAPVLVNGFSTRPETVPGLASALVPGGLVALVPGGAAAQPRTGPPDRACGKTQVAVYAAESLWRSGDLDLLVWVVATSRASVLSGLVAAAAATRSDHVGDAESVSASFTEWLGQTSRRWLAVFDDLRNAADLEGLWPAGPTGRVLITTADPAIIPGERRAVALQVPEFSTREGMSYLMGRLTADPDQRLGAIDLVADLGREPQALAQASAVIARSSLSCRTYRDYYAQRRTQLAVDGNDPPSAAAVTWTLSVEHAERLAPGGGAQHLLALAALLDRHGVPGTVFTTAAVCRYLAAGGTGQAVNPDAAWNALSALDRADLLSIDGTTTPPTVRMSSTVQAAVRAATPKVLLDQVAIAAADALLEVWPADEPEPWLATDLRSCTISLWRATGDRLWAEGCHPLLVRAGQSMDGARLTGPAVAHWRELAATSDRVAGTGGPDTLMVGGYLVSALLAAGQAAEAVAWARWVLASRTRVLGPDDPSTLAAQTTLGRALMATGQADAAAKVLETAAAECERVLGADHLDTIGAQEELASACRSAGKPEATQLYQRVLASRERLQGPRHPDAMTTRQRLADSYLADGRVKEANSEIKRVLADRERVLGADHVDTIVARGKLAAAYDSAGRMASALQLYEQACQGYERVLGADDPQTLMSQANLAHAYYKAGRLSDATRQLRATLGRCEQVLPSDAALTQTLRESLKNIAGG